jgi:hypothetical protein
MENTKLLPVSATSCPMRPSMKRPPGAVMVSRPFASTSYGRSTEKESVTDGSTSRTMPLRFTEPGPERQDSGGVKVKVRTS